MYLGWFGVFGPPRWIQTFTQPEVISSNVHPFLKPARPNFWLKNKGQKVQDVQNYDVQFDPTKRNNNNNNNNNNPIQICFLTTFFLKYSVPKNQKSHEPFFFGICLLRHRHLSDSRLVLQGVPRESHVCRLGWPFGWGNHQRSRQRDHRWGGLGGLGPTCAEHVMTLMGCALTVAGWFGGWSDLFFKEFVCDKKQQKNTRRPSGFDFFPGDQFHIPCFVCRLCRWTEWG